MRAVVLALLVACGPSAKNRCERAHGTWVKGPCVSVVTVGCFPAAGTVACGPVVGVACADDVCKGANP